jgi:hypothetical protein
MVSWKPEQAERAEERNWTKGAFNIFKITIFIIELQLKLAPESLET